MLNALGVGHKDKCDLFKRMVFNVMACNCDDHVKNISFLMDRTGKWSLAPAYDVTFAFNPEGAWTSSHQMTINGKRKEIAKADFDGCAAIAGLKKSEKNAMISAVVKAVGRWKEFAAGAGVSEERFTAIEQLIGID